MEEVNDILNNTLLNASGACHVWLLQQFNITVVTTSSIQHEIVRDINQMGTVVVNIILFFIGLALLLRGYKLLKFVTALLGFTIGGALGLCLSSLTLKMLPDITLGSACTAINFIPVFTGLIFAGCSFTALNVALFAISGSCGAVVGWYVYGILVKFSVMSASYQWHIACLVIFAIVGGLIGTWKKKPLLMTTTAVTGACAIYVSLIELVLVHIDAWFALALDPSSYNPSMSRKDYFLFITLPMLCAMVLAVLGFCAQQHHAAAAAEPDSIQRSPLLRQGRPN